MLEYEWNTGIKIPAGYIDWFGRGFINGSIIYIFNSLVGNRHNTFCIYNVKKKTKYQLNEGGQNYFFHNYLLIKQRGFICFFDFDLKPFCRFLSLIG